MEHLLNVPSEVLKPVSVPKEAYDYVRKQYNSTVILKNLLEKVTPDSLKVIGITHVDLFIPVLTFVFGEAQLGGQVAVVSTARLRQEFYGLPADEFVLEERLYKEVIHELGHTFGLVHCSLNKCAMYLSTSIKFIDLKSSGFCRECQKQLNKSLQLLKTDR